MDTAQSRKSKPEKNRENPMTQKISATTWVYVLVQNPGGDEQIVGQRDSRNDITFIPTFLDKDSAMQGVVHMVKEQGKKFEIQAIIYEDLAGYAARGGFILMVLDGQGQVIDKLAP
jgi:spore cortex formation protein SpoVR/YcgB (stage V sporulation)